MEATEVGQAGLSTTPLFDERMTKARRARDAAYARSTTPLFDERMTKARRARDAAYARFILSREWRERYASATSMKWKFHRLKSLQIEATRKIGSSYIRDEKGKLPRDSGLNSRTVSAVFQRPFELEVG